MSMEGFEGAATFPVCAGLYAALSGSATLTTLLGGPNVFDEEPDDCIKPPYVLIGEATSVPWRTHTRKGEEVTVTIHIWSTQHSKKEVGDILSAMNEVIGDRPLTVAGYDVVRCFLEFTDTFKEDRDNRHGVVRYRVIAQEQ